MGIHTDLIREARELHPDIAGVREEQATLPACTVSRIEIETEEAAAQLDKPAGRYITLETEALQRGTAAERLSVAETLSKELCALLGPKMQEVLVVGLGNRQITPDALGPRTADRIFITRHIANHAPELAPAGMRRAAAISPGVLGSTGIETLALVQSVIREIQPDAVVCIDALAARRSERIGGSIQMNDSGIQPGAGIGNGRNGLNRASVGVPVIAIGVPLVAYASTIVQDVLSAFSGDPGSPEAGQLDALIERTARERFGELIVTPKEIDSLIHAAAEVLSEAVNRCLQAACYDEIHALCR